jgi:hypothetical protein
MFEVLILIWLTKCVGIIVEERGQKRGLYTALIIMMWFGGEFMGAIFGAIITGWSPSAQCLLYAIALAGGGLGAYSAYRIADRLTVALSTRASGRILTVSAPSNRENLTAMSRPPLDLETDGRPVQHSSPA